MLIVTDTGVGMTAATLARAFDPFFTTKPLGQGTGLGLSMVYGFVQQSGGKVLLRSKEGLGTTVTIYLPRHLEAASKPAEADVLAACHPQTSAVVGYTVLAATDGASGLQILDSATRIDLLVSDVGLPGGINGRQLADAARQRRLDLKVLFITGYSEVFTAGSGLLDEDMQVITKPFSLTAFADKVQGMVG